MRRGWIDLLRSLGDSLLELVGAEVAALRADLGESGRRLAIAVALAATAAFLFFWAVGAAGFTLYHLVSLWLPSWGAALSVLALYLLLGAIFGALARHRLRSMEVPAATFRRRLDDHRAWLEEQLLSDGEDFELTASRSEIDDQE